MKTAHAIICAAALTGSASAATILGLYNTGLDAGGSLLPENQIDPHYVLISVPAGSGLGPNAYIADHTKPPLSTGEWVPNAALSKWIAPVGDQSSLLEVNSITGPYTYRLTFDLTGYDPSTAVITGQWATDNNGVNILLNGASTGNINDAQFTVWTPFSISSGFVSGINTLDFVVNNIPFGPGSPSEGGSNPTGLRVELSGTAAPEPSVSALALIALAVAGLKASRHRRN